MRFLFLALCLLFAAPALPPAASAAPARNDCVMAAASEQIEARRLYQQGLRNLIVAADGDYEGLADLNRDLQIALAERRRDRLGWLLATKPERVVTDQGAGVFWNFDWTEEDEAAFAAADSGYAERSRKVEELRGLSDSHPDWPGLQLLVQQSVAPKDAFARLLTDFSGSQKLLEQRLAACAGQN